MGFLKSSSLTACGTWTHDKMREEQWEEQESEEGREHEREEQVLREGEGEGEDLRNTN